MAIAQRIDVLAASHGKVCECHNIASAREEVKKVDRENWLTET
jgi:hypothetical protein